MRSSTSKAPSIHQVLIGIPMDQARTWTKNEMIQGNPHARSKNRADGIYRIGTEHPHAIGADIGGYMNIMFILNPRRSVSLNEIRQDPTPDS